MKFDILFLLAELGNGGQERQLYYLVKMLSAHYKIGIIPVRFSTEDKYFGMIDQNLPVQIIQLQSNGNLDKVREIRSIVKQSKPKIVHSFTFHINFATWLATVGTDSVAFGGIRNRLVLYSRYNTLFGFISCAFLPGKMISNNHYFLEGHSRFFKRIYRLFINTRIIENGIELQDFHCTYPDSEKRADRKVMTASISRLYKEKRIDLLVDLVQSLRNKGVNIYHVHAGSGPELDLMQERINRYDLQEFFQFVGEVKDISEFLEGRDLFIHTADFEGSPNVVMEAMACGKPILTTDCGDAALLVQDGVNGFVSETSNLSSLEGNAVKILSNPEQLAKMGVESRRIAESNFDISAYAQKMLRVYERYGLTVTEASN